MNQSVENDVTTWGHFCYNQMPTTLPVSTPRCPECGALDLSCARVIAHDPRCYQRTGGIPDGLPDDLCDCRVYRLIDARAGHGYGETSDCLCGRNFTTVRGLREHITKARGGAS